MAEYLHHYVIIHKPNGDVRALYSKAFIDHNELKLEEGERIHAVKMMPARNREHLFTKLESRFADGNNFTLHQLRSDGRIGPETTHGEVVTSVQSATVKDLLGKG